MTFSFLFIIKNSHFIKSHILSSLNFENIEIVYSNAVSPLFYYTLHFKKKQQNTFYMNVWSFYYILHCMPEFFCTCIGRSFYLQFTIFLLLHSVKRLAKHFSEKYFVISEIYFMISCCDFQVLSIVMIISIHKFMLPLNVN